MSAHLQNQIDVLRSELAFLGRTVRTQADAINQLTARLNHYAASSKASMRHMIMTLDAASRLDADCDGPEN